MNSSDQLPEKRQLTLLLVGSPGSGKTALALQFPNLYVIDCDGNLQGPTDYLKRSGLYKPYKWDTAFVDDAGKPVSPFNRYNRVVSCLQQAAADPSIDTIYLTSLTAFRDMVKDDILRQRASNVGLGDARNKFPVTEQNRGMTGLMQPEWDTFAFYFRNLVTSMRGCGKTFILDAHYEKQQNEADKMFYETLAIPGQSRYNLAALFTDTWQTVIVTEGFGANAKTERKVRTIPNGILDEKGCKTSLDLPQVFSNEGGAAMKLILPQLVRGN